MFPPFELRWTRAIVYELSKAIGMMVRPPFSDPEYPQAAPVDEQTMKLYKLVTMSPYVSPLPCQLLLANERFGELEVSYSLSF